MLVSEPPNQTRLRKHCNVGLTSRRDSLVQPDGEVAAEGRVPDTNAGLALELGEHRCETPLLHTGPHADHFETPAARRRHAGRGERADRYGGQSPDSQDDSERAAAERGQYTSLLSLTVDATTSRSPTRCRVAGTRVVIGALRGPPARAARSNACAST